MAADSVSLSLWFLYLVSRGFQRQRLPLAGQLDVHRAALDRRYRIRLHGLAYLASALQRRPSVDSSRFRLRQGAIGISKSLGGGLLRRGNCLRLMAFRLRAV